VQTVPREQRQHIQHIRETEWPRACESWQSNNIETFANQSFQNITILLATPHFKLSHFVHTTVNASKTDRPLNIASAQHF
jgi:hypothetical protein